MFNNCFRHINSFLKNIQQIKYKICNRICNKVMKNHLEKLNLIQSLEKLLEEDYNLKMKILMN